MIILILIDYLVILILINWLISSGGLGQVFVKDEQADKSKQYKPEPTSQVRGVSDIFPTRTFSQIYIFPNVHFPKCTFSHLYVFPYAYFPKCILFLNVYFPKCILYIFTNIYFHKYIFHKCIFFTNVYFSQMYIFPNAYFWYVHFYWCIFLLMYIFSIHCLKRIFCLILLKFIGWTMDSLALEHLCDMTWFYWVF